MGTHEELQNYIEKATLKELCMSQIWSSVMEGTAWCGWTDRSREDLVKRVQEAVEWAIERKSK